MAVPDYPDRDEWPRYWQTMRHFGIAVLVALVVIIGFLLLEPATPWLIDPWRSVVEALAIGAIVAWVLRRLDSER